MKRKLNYGDIFSLEVAPKKYAFGRVLFDVDQQYTPYYNEDMFFDNYMNSYFGCQLVEMYKGIYDSPEYRNYNEILINHTFVINIDSKYNRNVPWQKVGRKEVDYKIVEFPEQVGNVENGVWLMRGELMFQFFSVDDALDLPVSMVIGPTVEILADACLFLQDRKDLIEGFVADEYLIDSDLQYHPLLREKLYKEVGRDINKSYYDLANDEGFDLARFYK